jgi:hypothetical protein
MTQVRLVYDVFRYVPVGMNISQNESGKAGVVRSGFIKD